MIKKSGFIPTPFFFFEIKNYFKSKPMSVNQFADAYTDRRKRQKKKLQKNNLNHIITHH